jgi:hypothetical protein
MQARLKAIEVPHATATETLGINDRGQIVDGYVDARGTLYDSVAHGKKGSWRPTKSASTAGRKGNGAGEAK